MRGRTDTSPKAPVPVNSLEPKKSNSTTALGIAPPRTAGPRTEKLSRVWRMSKPKTGLSADQAWPAGLFGGTPVVPTTNRADCPPPATANWASWK